MCQKCNQRQKRETPPCFVALVPVPSAFHCISHVLTLTPKNEVVRPYARRVVTSVADKHALGNLSRVRHFPRHPMRQKPRSLVRLDRAISPRCLTSGPDPTTLSNLDMPPEPLLYWSRLRTWTVAKGPRGSHAPPRLIEAPSTAITP